MASVLIDVRLLFGQAFSSYALRQVVRSKRGEVLGGS